jgi:hypothetical protein
MSANATQAQTVSWRTNGDLVSLQVPRLVVLLTLACVHLVAAQQLRPPIDDAPASLPCLVPSVDTSGWRRYESQIAPISVLLPPDFTFHKKSQDEEWLRGPRDFTFRSVTIRRDTAPEDAPVLIDGVLLLPEPSPAETCSAVVGGTSIRIAAYQTSGYTHTYIADAAWPASGDTWLRVKASDARHEKHEEMLAIVRSVRYRP